MVASSRDPPRLLALEDPPVASAAQDHYAVGQAEHLVEIGTDDDHRHAMAGEIGDDVVDRGARADVDAAGRLVENDDFRLAQNALGDDDFLLVAARELVDPLPGDALDEKAGDAARRELVGLRRRDPAGRRNTLIIAEREIVGDRLRQDEALRFAVLRNQHDPVVKRVARPIEAKDVAADPDAASGDRVGARDRAHQFGAARSDNAGDAENLPRPDREADVLECAFLAGQAFDLDQRRRGRGRRNFREHPVQRPADHLLDQRLDRDLRVVVGRHQPSVAEHDDPVRDAGDLVEAMADVDEADAVGFQAADLLEQALGFLASQSGGRLVEDQEARVEGQRLGDFDLLLGCDPQIAHPGRRRGVQPEAMQLLGGAPVHEVAVDAAAAHRQAPDEDVFRDRQIEKQPHLLVDEADSGGKSVCRRVRSVGLSAPGHRSGRRLDQTRDDRGGGRFSCAVFPDQGEGLARPDVEVDVAEDRDRAVFLSDPAQGEPARILNSASGKFKFPVGPEESGR